MARLSPSDQIKTGKRFAVKVISKQLMRGKEAMILNEIEVLKKVSRGHGNIVTLWDYFETPNNRERARSLLQPSRADVCAPFHRLQVYLVMDLCTGGELFDRICEKGSYYESDAADIIRVVVSAISYLHSQNIVHRDIKAENLLFKSRESSDPLDLVIADFGLSKMMDEDKAYMLMTTCGTPGYMAPEVIKRTGHTKPVDMWSLGVLTYFLWVDKGRRSLFLAADLVSPQSLRIYPVRRQLPSRGNPKHPQGAVYLRTQGVLGGRFGRRWVGSRFREDGKTHTSDTIRSSSNIVAWSAHLVDKIALVAVDLEGERVLMLSPSSSPPHSQGLYSEPARGCAQQTVDPGRSNCTSVAQPTRGSGRAGRLRCRHPDNGL